MNLGDISVLASVIAGLVAIPFAASTITVQNDYGYGLSAILNTTPDMLLNGTDISGFSSKTVSDELIEYVYQTPQGKFVVRMYDGKFETALTNIGRKVSSVQTPEGQTWALQLPSESIVINQTDQRIVETYKNLDGYLEITREGGTIFTTTRGTASESALQSSMLRLEGELNYSLALIQNMTSAIMNVTQQSALQYSVFITNINASAEWVEILNNGSAVSMDGWILSDAANHIYSFIDFSLNASSSVRIYSGASGSGTNNVTDLYWTTSNIWNDAGDSATLKDSAGRTQSKFCYGSYSC